MSPAASELFPSRIVIARGALAAEGHLLDRLVSLCEAVRGDWAQLAEPVRVVVPSRSLRDHLAARLVRRLGGGAAGVEIQTLRALAHTILERAGEGTRGGERLVAVLVRRFASAESALADGLARFEDGYGAAVASVEDLLDAGLGAPNGESVEECLEAPGLPVSAASRARARALVRVALRVEAALAKEGLEPRAGFFRRACERLRARPEHLPTRALFLHGWADVTGVQLDLLEALVKSFDGEVVLDHPLDPADPDGAGPGPRWTERLRVRLGLPEVSLEAAVEPPALRTVAAPGRPAEVRAVARAVRGLLDGGVAPESIGLVLREPAGYRDALRTQLERLAIPFSTSLTSLGPIARRIRALLELIERREGCPADRWLDAQARWSRLRRADLRLAFHGIGVGRLRDVASLDLERTLDGRDAYALPVRRGLVGGAATDETQEADDPGDPSEREADDAPDPVRLARRHVSRDVLLKAIADAQAVRSRVDALASQATLGAQLATLRALLTRDLGWSPERPAAGSVLVALAGLERELGAGTGLAFPELVELLRRELGKLGEAPLGGEGAGVAVLSAIEARGRTFEHLFVLGMNRDVFPRTAREDPLLPDALRRALEVVLPDVPVKARAEDEERYLFAALCGAAPALGLSWLAVDDNGKERARSPLVEPLSTSGFDATRAKPVLAEPGAPRPALEHAIRDGLAGRPTAALALALGSDAVAETRVAATRLLDTGGWGQPLGPFFGFVGGAAPGDPRLERLSVTRLEGLARCPWQAFLERVLGLQPPPDALAELPDASALLRGNVVHAVLEAVAREAGVELGGTLAEATRREPVQVPWPSDARLEEMLREAADRAAREEGIVLAGFARHLATRARSALDNVRKLDWAEGSGPAVLGAELEGTVSIGPNGRELRFRADRADRLADGVALVDYKTGAAIDGKKADTRRRKLLEQIAEGRRLQGPAYARAGREGRYLFAKDDLEPAMARVTIDHEDVEARERFEAAAADLLEAFERGAFPPRLLGSGRTGKAKVCDTCEVADACLQGETGHAQHLAAWLTHHEAAPHALPPAPRAALALLRRLEGKT